MPITTKLIFEMAPAKAVKSKKAGLQKGPSKKATVKNVKKMLSKNQCRKFLKDKGRFCTKAKDAASSKYCHHHMHQKIEYVNLKLTVEEAALIMDLRDNDMLGYVQHAISDWTEDDWTEPDWQDLREFDAIQELKTNLHSLIDQFNTKARI